MTVNEKTPETPEYTNDDIIPYLPTDEAPTKGSDDKQIPDNYINVTFKSSDKNKGLVRVGNKEGEIVHAKVKPMTKLVEKVEAGEIEARALPGNGFVNWSPEFEIAIAGQTYTANFMKSGQEVGENDPIPQGWFRVKVTQDNTIKSETVADKYYAVAPNYKLSADKFVNLEGKALEGYENPAWYVNEDVDATAKPSEVAITKDTTFIAKATKIVEVPAEKSKSPTVNKITEGDKEITGKGVPGSDIEVELPDGTKITGKVDENGNWKVVVPADKELKKDGKIKVTQKEKDKEISNPVETTVNEKPAPAPVPQPKPVKIKLTFDTNKGIWSDGTSSDKYVYAEKGEEVTILEKPTKEGYKFLYWKGSEYQPGDKYIAVEDHTFVAEWEKIALPTPEKSETPEVNDINEGDKEITGKGKPNSDIIVELPDGTKITGKVDENGNWKVNVPADKELKKDEVIKVTQKEKGKEESPVVTTTVKGKEEPKPTDADKYQPIGKDLTVEVGGKVNPDDTITNLKDLPKGTKVIFKTPLDTNKVGIHEVVVEVEYPDGSKDEVKVKITVKEKTVTTPQQSSTANPNTGDAGIAIFIPIVIVAGIALFFVSKKKINR